MRDLQIDWRDNDHVFMTGPAARVFSGGTLARAPNSEKFCPNSEKLRSKKDGGIKSYKKKKHYLVSI